MGLGRVARFELYTAGGIGCAAQLGPVDFCVTSKTTAQQVAFFFGPGGRGGGVGG